MKRPLKHTLAFLSFLGFGAARLHFEAGFSDELRGRGLLAEKPETDTREKIGQTFSAISLGGLRTLVATFLNLRAFTAFTGQKWDEVADTYETIVDLAPHTRYYWESGWHHMAYNAPAYFLADRTQPIHLRKDEWRMWIHRGRAFLERGVRNNPEDWQLLADLGFMLSDPNKFVAFRDPQQSFAAAADAYRKAAETGKAMDFIRRRLLYALARTDGKHAEALALAKELYAEGRQHRTPTLLCILLALEAAERPEIDAEKRAVELFGSERRAYDTLARYWQRTKDRYPVNGIAAALGGLEESLGIPHSERVSLKPLPPAPDTGQWFETYE